jgi:hypothetical protein
MRIAFGISAVVAGLGMMPAVAVAGPFDLVTQAPQSVEGRLAPRHTPLDTQFSSEFHVRNDVLTASASVDPFADPNGTMQHRFASSMIDYYPLHGSGLRISAGVRFFQTNNFMRDAEHTTQGLLYNPHLLGSGATARTGFAKKTPAVTVGYTTTVKKAMFGFEIGSLVGNANANLPRSLEMMSNRGRGGMNPIANVVFGLRF